MDQNQSQPERFSGPIKMNLPRPASGTAVEGAQNGTQNETHQSPTLLANATPSLVKQTCSTAKTCGTTGRCKPSDKAISQSSRSSPKLQPLSPSCPAHIADSETSEIPQRTNGKEEELPSLTQANCCNGLFDCSSLPPNLWMPLHQMSTSYERGNNTTKSLISKTTILPSPADLVSGPQDDDSTEEGSLTLPMPRLNTPALKGSVERAEMATDLEPGQDGECCFGILRCEDEKPSVESSWTVYGREETC